MNSNEAKMCCIKGFTLIELLVVVLIIGVLVAVSVPQYKKAVTKSRFTQAKLVAHEIANAQQIYYLANGTYATSLNQLDIGFPVEPSGATVRLENSICVMHAQEVLCRLTGFESDKFGYQIFYPHTDQVLAGKCRCLAYPSADSLSYKLCKADTRLTQPDAAPSAYAYFTYP